MHKNTLSHFKTFPEFSKLTSRDRDVYEAYMQQFPPVSVLNFGTLMTWWSALGTPGVAVHNKNLVVSLWYPGLEEYSGFTVIGRQDIDETICAVFDYQKQCGEKPYLTCIPEFVANKIRYMDMFVIDRERRNDECILDVNEALDLDNFPAYRKTRLKRLLSTIGEDNIRVLPLDIDSVYERDRLMELIDDWRDKGELNGFTKHEEESLKAALRAGGKMGFSGLGMYVNQELHSFLILAESQADDYEIVSHSRFSYAIPNCLDVAIYAYGKWFQENGIRWVNIDADLDFPELRRVRLYIGPSDFLRMYRITPL